MSLASKLRNRLLKFQWHFLRRVHKPTDVPAVAASGPWVNPEQFIRELLARKHGQSFLEIGIGESPNLERLHLMSQHGVTYTACDFQQVCEAHERTLRRTPTFDLANARFLGNTARATYSWTLFELVRSRETFDIIYLDGNHTFYIDCPGLILAHFLLKPGGILLVDDVSWTLAFMRNLLMTSFPEWRFYRKMYDFSQYDEAQQRLPHVGIMAETMFLDKFGYSKLEEYSTPHWWALRKPHAG
jgi:predicted O-methyltransferase YrrM